MKNREEVYQELRKEYTDEELADSYIFSVDLPVAEKQAVQEEFVRLRMEHRKNRTPQEKMKSDLFVLKLRMKSYFEKNSYDKEFKFSVQLRNYIQIINRSHIEVAKNLGIHKTKLSRLVNGRDRPNIELMYRLEAHSSQEIPASYWWKLYARELEYTILTDDNKRRVEASKVEDIVNLDV
jgi:plasmid maintenance system antidote protein VapI